MVLGQLYGERAHAARARMYQHFVAGLDVGDIQHGLPRRERHQRQGSSLFKPQALGLERGLVLMHGYPN